MFEYKVRCRHKLGWKEIKLYADTDIEEFFNRNSIDYVRNATDTVENRLFKENKRLNNIINELEKELFIKKEFYERELTKRPTNDSEYNTQYADSCALAQICVIYDKLQELKGSESNE